jgi:hypothetical protein
MKVKRLGVLASLGVLILGVTLIMGCAGGAKEAPTTSHFEASGISFDYPSAWKILKSDDPIRIAFLGEVSTNTNLQVFKETVTGFTLKSYHDNFAIALMVGGPISGNPLTVAGLDAYEGVWNMRKDTTDFRIRQISLAEDGIFYTIFFSTTPASFDKVNKDFDTVINSFKFQ